MKVVVFGSDRYLMALMPTFLHFYNAFWADNPWSLEVVSQTVKFSGLKTVMTGPDRTFSEQVLRWATGAGDDPFLMMLDDYFLSRPVDTDMVLRCCEEMSANRDIVHVNLKMIGGDTWRWRYNGYLGEFDKGRCDWLFQNQAGLWRPQLLRDLTRPDENGWQMEIRGSQRAKHYPGRFLTVYENAIDYVNYMGRAGPRQEGLNWLAENGMAPIYP